MNHYIQIPQWKVNHVTEVYLSTDNANFYSLNEYITQLETLGLQLKSRKAALQLMAYDYFAGHIVRYYVECPRIKPTVGVTRSSFGGRGKHNDLLALSALCGFILRLFKI